MATILTHAIIANATGVVDTYVATANGLHEELEEVIQTLTGANFNGDAAEGYKAFFMQQVTPALTVNLTATNDSLMAGVKSILSGVQSQLLDTVDPQLGEHNSNPGGGQ